MPRTLISALVVLCVALPGPGCRRASQGSGSVQAVYDKNTGRLTELTYDANSNGKIDTWTYMDGTTLLRAETDRDEDGRIDRWEYYGPERRLEKVGFSGANDGVVDGWAYPGPDGAVARVEISTRRDGTITRREFYEKGLLARVEEDADGDGRVDKWETYRNSALAELALDTEHRGVPDRRLIYRADGSVERVDIDVNGDGVFEPAKASPGKPVR